MLMTPFRCWLKRDHWISYGIITIKIIFYVVLKLVNSILPFFYVWYVCWSGQKTQFSLKFSVVRFRGGIFLMTKRIIRDESIPIFELRSNKFHHLKQLVNLELLETCWDKPVKFWIDLKSKFPCLRISKPKYENKDALTKWSISRESRFSLETVWLRK